MNKLVLSAVALLMFAAPAAQAKSHKHHGGKYALNAQMQQLKAEQKFERQACKREGGNGCANLKATQKEQRRELKRQLKGK